jgi:hypothetical protein
MFDNPKIQELPENVWTKVAENIKNGFIHILKGDLVYYQTYKLHPDYFPDSEVSQLALVVEEGDIAERTDENKSYIALNSDNNSINDWRQLAGDAVPDDSILVTDDLFEGVAVYYRLERIAGETVVVGFAGIKSAIAIDVYLYCEDESGRVRVDRGT